MPSIKLGKFLSVPDLLNMFFNHARVLDFVKSFSVSIEVTMWFLSFFLLIWCSILIYFHMLKQPCILG